MKQESYISTITIAKIIYGAYKSSDPLYHIENLEKILLPIVKVVCFDEKAAYVCGQLQADLEKKGQPLSFADCFCCNSKQSDSDYRKYKAF